MEIPGTQGIKTTGNHLFFNLTPDDSIQSRGAPRSKGVKTRIKKIKVKHLKPDSRTHLRCLKLWYSSQACSSGTAYKKISPIHFY